MTTNQSRSTEPHARPNAEGKDCLRAGTRQVADVGSAVRDRQTARCRSWRRLGRVVQRRPRARHVPEARRPPR